MLKLAVFGAGRMGSIHARSVNARNDACIAAVVDPNQDAAAALAIECGAIVSVEEAVFDDPSIDAVIIASAAKFHADQIMAAARTGKAVFCEKPIAIDLPQVERSVAEVERSGIPFMLGFNRRFDPNFDSMKSRIASGSMGAVEILILTSRDPSPPPLEYLKSSGGIVRESSIHDIDMASWLTGEEPLSVYAQAASRSNPEMRSLGLLDTVVIVMTMPSGALVTINNSFRASYGYDQRVEAHCANGILQVGNLIADTITVGSEQGFLTSKPLAYFTERYAEAYRREMHHFLTQLQTKSPIAVTARNGLNALRIAEAAMLSIESGKAVQMAAS